MAGAKGKSGGPRDGAGRKPAVVVLQANSDDPLEFLRLVMQETTADGRLRIRAAVELAKIEKGARPGTLGKKGAQTSAAKDAAQGKFAPGSPPRLVASNDK